MAYFTFNSIAVSGLASAVPDNNILVDSFSGKFTKEAIEASKKSTGVESFYRAEAIQTASDLGYIAAKNLLEKKSIDTEQVGIIIFLSKTPDYRSPATSIVLHKRLNLTKDCLAFDVNMGSTGFVYGMQIGCSLLDTINKKYALVVVGDTSGKQIAETDPITMQYGDGTSVILLEKKEGAKPIYLETFADGEGFKSYLVPGGAFRTNKLHESLASEGITREHEHIHVNHEEMEDFAVTRMPQAIKSFTQKNNITVKDYDFVALQQYNSTVLNNIAQQLNVESLPANLNRYGNTAGNSIPLLLSDNFGGKTQQNVHVLAGSFGEGFSWGVADFYIAADDVLEVIVTGDIFDDGHVTHEMSV